PSDRGTSAFGRAPARSAAGASGWKQEVSRSKLISNGRAVADRSTSATRPAIAWSLPSPASGASTDAAAGEGDTARRRQPQSGQVAGDRRSRRPVRSGGGLRR